MIHCRECGAELPEHARFCLNCGTPVPPPEPEPPANTPPPPPPPPLDFLQPSILGGIALGLLSSLPLINYGNCLCCMWVFGGGALAAHQLKRQRPGPGGGIAYGDAAFVGVMSGFFGALISTVMIIPVKAISAQVWAGQKKAIEDYLGSVPGLDGPMKDLLLRAASPEISPTTLMFTFISNLIVYSLFAMLGAIIYLAVIERKAKQATRSPK